MGHGVLGYNRTSHVTFFRAHLEHSWKWMADGVYISECRPTYSLPARDQSFTHNPSLSVKFNAVSGYLNSIRGYIRAMAANDSVHLSKW